MTLCNSAPSHDPARRRRRSVRLPGLLYQVLIRLLATAEAAQPARAASPAMGAMTIRAIRGMASRAATGVRAAASLARISVRTGVGQQARRSGASSAETVTHDRLPLTWPVMKVSAAAPAGRA